MRTAFLGWAGAAALCLAMPVCAQTGVPAASPQLAAGEILLHIEAQGSAPADYATLDIAVSGQGNSKEEADAARREAEQALLSALADAGIDKTRIELGETSYTDFEDFDWAAADVAAAAAAVEAAAYEASAAVDAVEDEGAAVGDEQAVAMEYDAPRITRWSAASPMVVTVDDLATIDEVVQVASAESYDSRPTTVFRFHDEAKSERAAIADALVQARIDGEAYADALGYRVVRIAGVSNTGPDLGLAGFLQTITALDGRTQELLMFGRKTVPIAVDFVIVPK